MLTLSIQLESIFERSGLRPESGRPLFAYRLTDAERDALAEGLRRAFSQGQRDGVVATAFVLFGASDFCANHRYGPWSWDHIFSATEWTEGAAGRLYDLVIAGLRRFGRPLQSTDFRFAYLGTLACEGGLPLAMLRGRQAGSLSRYFRQLLAVTERYSLGPPEILELAAELQTILPGGLQNSVVHRMAADLVHAVACLRAEAAATGVECADLDGHWLDLHHPDWKRELPLRVDSDVAGALLRGLLRLPRWDGGATQAAPVVVRLRLVSGATSSRLERDVDVAPRALAADLASLLNLKPEALPPLFYLFAMATDGSRRAIAVATRIANADAFQLTAARPARPFRDVGTVFDSIQVVASVGSRDVGQGLPAGGGAISTDLPMALIGNFEHGSATLRSPGSARTLADHIDVICPGHQAPVALDESQVEKLEAPLPTGLELFRVQGTAEWSYSGERCVFRSNDQDVETEYVLSGRLHRFGPLGTEVHAGLPDVAMLRNDVLRRLPRGQIEWRPEGRGESYRNVSQGDAIGNVWIRACEEGATLFRTRIVVLPPDLEVALRTGDETGVVQVCHANLRAVTCLREVSQHLEIANPEPGHFELSLRAEPNLPDRLSLSLLFAGGREARLTVSSPARVMSFVDLEGRTVTGNGTHALERLGSLRARAVGRGNDNYALEARRQGRRWRLLADLPQLQPGVFELSLEQIRPRVAQLLAAEESTDAEAELRIVHRGAPMRGLPTLHVSRYDGRLEPIRDAEGMACAVRLDHIARAGLSDATLGALRADIRRVESPAEDEARTLTCLKPGLFEVPIDDLEPGPWLAVAWDGRWARFRPLLLTVPGQAGTPCADVLGRAIRLVEQEERVVALDASLRSMAGDAEHPSWPRAMEVIESLVDLPTMTFELSSALVRQPRALALLLLMEAHRLPVLWARFEELPFLWATLPVDDWVDAFGTLFEHFERLFSEHAALLPVELIRSHVDGLRERTRELAPFMDVVLDAVALRWPERLPTARNRIQLASSRAGFDAMVRMESEAAREALRDGGDLRWPQLDLSDLAPSPHWVAAGVPDLGWGVVREHHRDVLAAPCVAARLAASGRSAHSELVMALRTAREFDPRYFQAVHALHLACELASGEHGNRETRETI